MRIQLAKAELLRSSELLGEGVKRARMCPGRKSLSRGRGAPFKDRVSRSEKISLAAVPQGKARASGSAWL